MSFPSAETRQLDPIEPACAPQKQGVMSPSSHCPSDAGLGKMHRIERRHPWQILRNWTRIGGMHDEDVPKVVVERRVRNRRIEVLDLTASFEAQREYQRQAPVAVANEVINQWEDWTTDPLAETFDMTVYTPAEVEAVRTFHAVWEHVCDVTPDPLPPLEETQTLEAWGMLRDAAIEALRVFAARGRLPED
jgi:hypothetical protein